MTDVTSKNFTVLPYKNVDNTLSHIFGLIQASKQTDSDQYLTPFAKYDLMQVYDYVRALPYVKDPETSPLNGGDAIELLKAPKYTMLMGGDCDCKAILLGSILERMNVPYRMAVVSTQPDKQLHHIYPEIQLNGLWVPFDATYPLDDPRYTASQPFVENPYTLKVIYTNSEHGLTKQETTENTPLTHGQWNNNMNSNLNGAHLLGSAKLGILSGNCVHGNCGKECPCKNNCSSVRTDVQQLLGRIDSMLGFDPSTVVTFAVGLFNSLFGSSHYDDAYHAYEQAVATNTQAANALIASNNSDLSALHTAATAQATIAVLLVDYMNPPGANKCTSPDRCGNRAEWSVIQPEVLSKVQNIVSYFEWRMLQHMTIDGPSLISAYQSYKTNSGSYAQFRAAYPAGVFNPAQNPIQTNLNQGINAGLAGGNWLVIGGAGLLIWSLMSKKKKKA